MSGEDVCALLKGMAAGREGTFCPSEAAAALVEAGELVCTQGGVQCHPLTARGPIRLAAGRAGGG